ncbi:hypothetical protein ABIB27_001262 [Arthrobacter sp. UYEF21]
MAVNQGKDAREQASGKVAGTEDGHGAERDLALADVGARKGRARRQGGVDPDAAEVALADNVREEHPQLVGGAATFTLATPRQP